MPAKISPYERAILDKYLKAPTLQEVKSFIEELGVSCFQFERFYNMPMGTLSHVMNGRRDLPTKYWPIIYEKMVPTYGLKYKQKLKEKRKREADKKTKPKRLKQTIPINPMGRLGEL